MIDIEALKTQVTQVISYSQNIPNPQVDVLIERWYRQKQRFIEMFGGQLIVELGEVEFHLSPQMRDNRINDFIDRLVNNYQHEELAKFVSDNRNGFFDNRVIKDYQKIPRGMKLIRAFRYFESENKALLERLQNEASVILQEDKIKGTLCVSVHPLDFLSSSENAYKWRSCHALDGEYRSGNLSYMCDSATFMVYVRGQEQAELPHFPSNMLWNSKKWRTLLFLSDAAEMIFAGRQYPFSTQDGLNTIGHKMAHMPVIGEFFKGYWWSWNDYVIDDEDLYSRYVRICRRLVALDEIVTDCSSLHYNDLKWSNYSHPQYIYIPKSCDGGNCCSPHFSIGAEVSCLWCGDHNIVDGSTMMCDECELEYGTSDNENYGYCDCCGRRMHWDDLEYITDDYRVCPDCFQEKAFICPQCGEVIFAGDEIYYAPNDEYYCSDCVENFQENEKKRTKSLCGILRMEEL